MKQITNGAITYSIADGDTIPAGYHEVVEKTKSIDKSNKNVDLNKEAKNDKQEK